MRTTASFATAVLILIGPGPVLAEETSSGDPPASSWEFDGSLKDLAGDTGDDLTVQGGKPRFVSAKHLPGIVGEAVVLGVEPGDAEFLTAKTSPDVKLGPNYTIEAWIHPTQIGGWNRLVLQWGNAPNYAYHLAVHNGQLSLCHGQADGRLIYCEGGRVVVNQLQHVAAVARRNDAEPARSTLTVYLNGRAAATATFDGTIRSLDNESLGIGDSASIPSPDCRFRGYLDELTVWNRALPPEAIQTRCRTPQRVEALRQSELAREKMQQDRIKAELAQRAAAVDRLGKFAVEEIVFAEPGFGRDLSGHYYANFGYSCIDPNYWLHSDDGGRLSKLNVRTGKLSVLLDDPGGAVRDPQVHYDARRILFSYRKAGTHRYHLYEINTDGTALRQITTGPYDDVEPVYLPGGDIVFCSTRCHRWIGYWLAESAVLYRCNAAGKQIRMLSSGSFTENTPAVLPDGRVLYTRWEYVNRDPVSFHHLWTMNPDGCGQMVYFGNMRPGGVYIDARPIPGTDSVVLINIPGHGSNEHVGYLATVTGKHGPNDPAAMKNISRSSDFRDPYPLSNDVFLAVRGNRIVLIDSNGEIEDLYEGTAMPLHEPRPIVRRPRQKSTAPRSNSAEPTATMIVGNVYRGRNMAGIEPGAVKKLLVMEELPKPANFHGGGSQPIGHGVTSTLKRILGTVPVEPDGSAHFEVPALRSIYFAILDQDDLSVKQMRSFVTLQPGETLGCVGCHEPRQETSANSPRPATLQAVARGPSRIELIAGVPQIMEFPRDVQPLLDRHCVRCHGHQRRDGGVALVGDRGPVFSHSYYELLLHWQVKDTGGDPQHGTGRQPGNDQPYTTYSSASALMDKIEPAHYDVRLSPLEKKLVRLWIDAGATYPGTYAAYGTGQIGGCWGNNEPVREMADDWPTTGPAVEAVGRRCGSCHPKGQLPQHVTDRIPLDSWGDMLSWTRPLSRYSRHRIYNLGRPEKSLVLLVPLSHKAGGFAQGKPVAAIELPQPVTEDRSRPPQPIEHPVVFDDTSDPDYRTILDHVRAANGKLEEIKRFDMPGFEPNEHYVREMRRRGVLGQSIDPATEPIDVYATDEAFWRSFWHRPTVGARDAAKP